MNPRYFVAAGAFVVALLVGAFAADALRSEKIPPQPAQATDEVVPVLAPTAVTPEDLETLDPATIPWVPVEVAAELVPIDPEAVTTGTGRAPAAEDPGFGDPATPGAEAEPGDRVDEGDTPPADPGFDFVLTDLGLPARFFGTEPVPWHRFIDFCADDEEDSDCPTGIGATVLADYDGPGEPGPFEISNTLYPRAGWWRCEDPGRLRTGQYQLMILATHPSRMEITYYPSTEPEARTTVVVDTATAPHPELGQWLDLMTNTGGPATGQNRVHHCFVLDGGRASRFMTIEASATSITGDTATQRFSFRTDENRRRPPVTLAPLSDYEMNVAMPFQNDGNHSTVLRVIESTEGLGCTDIERDAVLGSGRPVVPLPEGAYRLYSGFEAAEPMGDDIIAAPDWPYDPSYDTYHFWNLNLREGRGYLICMWWLQSPTRSFDTATVVDRESRWVLTPDRHVTRIRVDTVQAASGSGVAAESISVYVGACSLAEVPGRNLDRGEIYAVTPSEGLVCDYNGYEQPAVTEVRVYNTAGEEFTFAVPTDPNAPVGTGLLRVNLDVERTSGLCGSSFGPCDPPTTVYPGPALSLLIETYAGGESGHGDWYLRGPETFTAAPTEPVVLPELPQIDHFGSEIVAVGRDRLQVTAGFDRPVRLTATLRGAAEDPCLLGAAPQQVVDELRQVHTLFFGELCPLREYTVDLLVSDEDGTTIFYGLAPAEDVTWAPWAGWGITEGWPVRYIVALRQGLVGDYYMRIAEVAIDGGSGPRIDLRPENRCLTSTQSREQVAQWRDTVTVQIQIGFYDGRRDDGNCTYLRSGGEWTGSATAEVSVDDLRAGPISIVVNVTDSTSGLVVPVEIRITGRIGP